LATSKLYEVLCADINEPEADIIRSAMARYVELASVRLLADELNRQGVKSRATKQSDGRIRGGVPFGRGGLRHLLQNRLYIGEIVHKGETHPGSHEPIVSHELFDRVQQMMADQTRERIHGTRAIQPSLLSGLVHDGHGRSMCPSHAVKAGKRYRYYITHPRHIAVGDPSAGRVPAHDFEQGVVRLVGTFLENRNAVASALANMTEAEQIEQAQGAAERAARSLSASTPGQQRGLLLRWVERIDIDQSCMRIEIRLDEGCTHNIEAAVHRVRRGNDVALHIQPDQKSFDRPRDEPLVALIADARAARLAVINAPEQSIDAVASSVGVGVNRFKRLIRISYLAPSIIEAILDGSQPGDLTVPHLNTVANIPRSWDAQKKMFGIA
jgi:site-specific DNA recombinase